MFDETLVQTDVQARSYYITDKAYNRLIIQAQKSRYVHYGSNRVIGMSLFLNDLSESLFQDTRPSFTRERHDREIRNGHAPVWVQSNARRNRLLKLTEDALDRYVYVAYQVGIIRADPWPIGGPARRTPYPIVSLVIEGIGLGWITPDMWPMGLK